MSEVDRFVEGFLGKVREAFDLDDKLNPMGLIFGTVDPETGREKPDLYFVSGKNLNKDLHSTFLQEIVRTTRAKAVVVAAESWLVERENAAAWVGRMQEHHPDAREVRFRHL